MVAFGCTCGRLFRRKCQSRICVFNTLDLAGCSPEKAGVGGSIPSLATIVSTTYKHAFPGFRSISFQLNSQNAAAVVCLGNNPVVCGAGIWLVAEPAPW